MAVRAVAPCVRETVKRINTSFPHWFCDNFLKYNDAEGACPVDQHMLIALRAQAGLRGQCGEGPLADPKEFLSAMHAEPVYELLGAGKFGADEMPPLNKPIMGRHLPHPHRRPRRHRIRLAAIHGCRRPFP